MANATSDSDAKRFQRRISFVFAADFITIGVFNTFFPLWLDARGLSSGEIGTVLAVQFALRVLTVPLVLRLADASSERANVLLASAFVSAILVNLLFIADGFWQILIATLVVALAWAPLVPLTDAVALAGRRRLGADYGKARLWGSVAFIVANVVAGLLVGWLGAGSVPMLLSASFVVAAIFACLTPRLGAPLRSSPIVDAGPGEAVVATRSSRRRWRPPADIGALIPTMAALGLIQSSHAMVNGFAPIAWAGLGYSAVSIGFFVGIGVVVEVILFRLGTPLLKRFGARGLLLLAAGAAILRWIGMTFDAGFLGFALLQCLHGLTFGGAWLALQATIAENVPEERLGRAQSAGFFLQTGLTAGATFVSGPAFAAYGQGAFLVMAMLAGAGLLLAIAYPQRLASGGQTSDSR